MTALQTTSALAKPTRMAAFQILVGVLRDGLGTSELANALGIAHDLLSTHLVFLSRAELVSSTKSDEIVTCCAPVDTVKRLALYLERAADHKAMFT